MPAVPRCRCLSFVLPAMLILLAACSDPPDKIPAKGASGTGQAPVGNALSVREIPGTVQVKRPIVWDIGSYGGVWNDTYNSEPTSFNPFSNLDGTFLTVIDSTIDYFFDYDPDTREWKGNLIDTYSITTDKALDRLELTCKLRPEVYWNDGVKMTVDDVVYSYNDLAGNKEIAPREYTVQFITMADGSEKRIEIQKIDELTFKFIFPRIVANPILNANSTTVVARHIWDPVKKAGGVQAVRNFWNIATPPEKIVGNGPFLLERYVPGERFIFKRNPNYWKKDEKGNRLPYLDRIVLTRTPDFNSELLKFQAGEIESFGLRGKDLATLMPEARAKGYSIWNGGPAGSYTSLIFNQNPKAIPEAKQRWFNSANFRKAISCLVDRKTIIEQVVNGLAEPVYHVISEYNRYFNPARATPYAYNPTQAKELLAAEGFKDSNNDGLLEDAQGVTVAFDIMLSSIDQTNQDFLNIIVTDLKKAGIKATLVVLDPNVMQQKLLYNFDWDCFLAGMGFPTFTEQWINVWRSSGDRHYWNPKQTAPRNEWEKRIDEIYNTMVYTYDDNEVRRLYDEFQKVLMDELVIIPISRRYSFSAVYDKWGNINWDVRHSLGDGQRRVYLKKTR
jgi:peptide/nickel transport system substrate-binding protein